MFAKYNWEIRIGLVFSCHLCLQDGFGDGQGEAGAYSLVAEEGVEDLPGRGGQSGNYQVYLPSKYWIGP